MTDELYDYFGGNASKKVEPIEDDEFDNEVEDEGVSQEPVEATAEPVQESSDEPQEAVALDTEGKKAGHWDFLANMLGISSSKKATPKTEASSDSDSVSEVSKDDVSKSEVREHVRAGTDSVS